MSADFSQGLDVVRELLTLALDSPSAVGQNAGFRIIIATKSCAANCLARAWSWRTATARKLLMTIAHRA